MDKMESSLVCPFVFSQKMNELSARAPYFALRHDQPYAMSRFLDSVIVTPCTVALRTPASPPSELFDLPACYLGSD